MEKPPMFRKPLLVAAVLAAAVALPFVVSHANVAKDTLAKSCSVLATDLVKPPIMLDEAVKTLTTMRDQHCAGDLLLNAISGLHPLNVQQDLGLVPGAFDTKRYCTTLQEDYDALVGKFGKDNNPSAEAQVLQADILGCPVQQ